MKKMCYYVTALQALIVFSLTSLYSYADNVLNHSAVVLVYHHVADNTPASTSVTPETFQAHIEYLAMHLNPTPLDELVSRLQNGKDLSANSIAITFDDGYENIYNNAHPILKQNGIPYTVFINPLRIGKEPGQLNWDQVVKMQNEGVTFANHTLDHIHLLNKLPNETESQWLERIWQNVEQAQQILEQKLVKAPKWLAYPFGEYNKVLQDKLAEENYIGFAQHSGGISIHSSFSALTRFPAAGIYAKLSSLKIKMHSLAMPILSAKPDNPERQMGDTIELEAKVQTDDMITGQMQCFYNGQRIAHTFTNNTIQVNSDLPVPVGRSRVNCTVPSRSQPGRYYWYSHPFFLANAKGIYPD